MAAASCAGGRGAPEGFLDGVALIEASAGLSIAFAFLSASIFSRVSGRSLCHLENLSVMTLLRPFAGPSVFAIFLGRSTASTSSLLRFFGGFGRFSAECSPFGCWLLLGCTGGGEIAGVMGRASTGWTAIESAAGLGAVTLIEGWCTGGGGTPLVPAGPLNEALLCSLILFGSGAIISAAGTRGSGKAGAVRGVVR